MGKAQSTAEHIPSDASSQESAARNLQQKSSTKFSIHFTTMLHRSKRGHSAIYMTDASPEQHVERNWDGAYKSNIASSSECHHYMPPNMPIFPVYESMYHQACNHSWKILCKGATAKMRQYRKDGIVLFYDEFFHRLFLRDPTFTNIFPGIRKRIEVLIKVMKFMLPEDALEEDVVRNRCLNLGFHHRGIPSVRPHHFATYTSTLVEVIMFWLDDVATPDIGEAWSNLIGFHLKYIFKAYLFKNVKDDEWSQNVTIPTEMIVRPDIRRKASKKDGSPHSRNHKQGSVVESPVLHLPTTTPIQALSARSDDSHDNFIVPGKRLLTNQWVID